MDHKLQHISSLLDQLDFNETEKRIYITGLELGTSSISNLASKAKLNRITTHQAVEKMIKDGIFLETHYGKRRLVYPTMADGLQKIIEKKQFQLTQLQSQLDASKSVFDYIATSRASMTNTRLYQGIEWINTTLIEIANDKKPVAIIYDANAMGLLVDEKLFHWSYSQRSKFHTHTKLILQNSFRDYRHVERKEDYDVSIKTLPDNQIIHGGIEIWWYKVALHCYREGRVTTTIIENQEIANILLIMYDSMRKSARDYQEQYLII